MKAKVYWREHQMPNPSWAESLACQIAKGTLPERIKNTWPKLMGLHLKTTMLSVHPVPWHNACASSTQLHWLGILNPEQFSVQPQCLRSWTIGVFWHSGCKVPFISIGAAHQHIPQSSKSKVWSLLEIQLFLLWGRRKELACFCTQVS